MSKKKIPKTLLLTKVELGDTKNPTMIYFDKLIQNYEGQIIWFSICEMKKKKYKNYNLPFKSHPPINQFVRIPLLKSVMRFALGTRYLTLLVCRFAKKYGAEAIFADLTSDVLSVSRMAAKKLKIPLITSIQDDPIARMIKKNYPVFIKKYIEREFNETMAYARTCAVVSDYMGEYYEKHHNVQTTTLYLGVDEELRSRPKKFLNENCTITIGSIGSIHCYRNFDLVIKAIDYLNKNYHEKSFFLKHIGDLPEKYLNVDNVYSTGWIKSEEVSKELEAIDIGLLSVSFNNSEKTIVMTSFPTKVYNFLEAQVPLLGIGPDYSAVAQFITEYNCGQVCNDSDTKNIVSKIKKIIDNKNNYISTRSGLLNTAEYFSRNQYFKNFEKIINVA